MNINRYKQNAQRMQIPTALRHTNYKRYSFWIIAILCLPSLLLPLSATAAEKFSVHAVWFKETDGAYALRASLSAGPDDLIRQLLQSGYAVKMLFEMRFMLKRKWRPDREIGDISWEPEILYDSLLNRYTFRVKKATEEFNTLSETLARAGTLQAAPARSSLLNRLFGMKDIYVLARYELETSHLPPPLQVSLLTGDGEIHSGWVRLAVILK